ncbi:hypothetical protein Bca52824_088958 [Brassica carinata]|uniref:Reverse transcriptase zinc-binding domain-containing protein n=2 Tax=Brassica TaxID=3705 RepID=A0A8X7TP53_BRACI|nr:hypothetical protein Bca52824_088958 [Brassica carinata]
MNSPRKKKESSLLHELKELELLEEGELVDIPELENEDLIEENSMSIIVRCLNPTVHKGRGVGENKVQFFCQHERDLQHVLTKGPWFVNGWIVSLDRWAPNPGPEFLCRIPFWIRIRGIPVHLLKKEAIEGLIGPLGKVEKVELHAKNSSSVDVLSRGNSSNRIGIRRRSRCASSVSRLTHDQLYCPMQEGRETLESGRRTAVRQEGEAAILARSRRQNKESTERRPITKRTPKGGRISRSEQSPRRVVSTHKRSEAERKGKNVVGSSSQVWQPKSSQSLPTKQVGGSRSTEESSTVPRNRSDSQGPMTTGASSGASHESPSVFNRLGGRQDVHPHSGQSSEKQRSNEKSNSSVFERLGGQEASPIPEKRITEAEPSGTKRRRLSRSDERIPKKAKVGELQEEGTPKGSGGRSSGSRSSSEKHHSASVAANAPNRSAQRIVLGSGKIVEEGRWYMEEIMVKLGFHDLRTVEPIGRSGGLAVLWKEACKVEILQAHRRLIDLKVTWKDKSFFLTGVYGEPVKGNRSGVWERLTRIGVNRDAPWFLTGDFNEIVDQSEKLGGALRSDVEGVEFRQMMSDCGLWEIQHKGYKLSWPGVRNNDLEWLHLFLSASARYLSKGCSDHSPVMNFLDGVEWRKRPMFRYDQRWIKKEGFSTIGRKQVRGEAEVSLMQRVANCRKAISGWKKTAKPNSVIRIQELHHRMDEASRRNLYVPGELKQLRQELNEDAGLGSGPFYAWRSIHAAQKLIQQGARVLIGSGEDTKVFQDSWIGQQPARRAQVVRWNRRDSRQYLCHNLRVREMLINQGREWNMELLTRIFPDDEARNISKIRTCGNGSKDIYIWDYNKKGYYTVKSGYWVQVNVLDRYAALAWSTETSPKVHHFLWRCISNLLPVAGNLARKHIAKEAGCLRCGCDTENVNHVLFQCPFALLVWALSPIPPIQKRRYTSRDSALDTMAPVEKQERAAV